MDKRVLFIGGSPCSGKSTVAEYISNKYGAHYFKVDDFLDKYIDLAAEKGYPVCKRCLDMTPEEVWMREPLLQCDEEFLIYEEISEMVFFDLQKIDADLIITEGAAYTPKVMKKYGVRDYITIVPVPDFQITHYKEREWVPFVLEGCSDKGQAFDNWMERDILFARQVKAECEENGVVCIVNDGSGTKCEMFRTVEGLFKLI